MPTCLLKKVLPFTLTFLVGALVGGMTGFRGARGVEKLRAAGGDVFVHRGRGPKRGEGCRNRRLALEPASAPDSKPLNVISKPRPDYPLKGLDYGVQGSVILDVTFGADGRIHNVTTIDGLPEIFGFNDAAESAARQMKFEPATRGGIPISVTRKVEYVFAKRTTDIKF